MCSNLVLKNRPLQRSYFLRFEYRWMKMSWVFHKDSKCKIQLASWLSGEKWQPLRNEKHLLTLTRTQSVTDVKHLKPGWRHPPALPDKLALPVVKRICSRCCHLLMCRCNKSKTCSCNAHWLRRFLRVVCPMRCFATKNHLVCFGKLACYAFKLNYLKECKKIWFSFATFNRDVNLFNRQWCDLAEGLLFSGALPQKTLLPH